MTSVQTAWKPLFLIAPDNEHVARMHRLVSVRPVRQRPDWIRLDKVACGACPVYRIAEPRDELPSWEM